MLDTKVALIILIILSLSWFALLGFATNNPGQKVSQYFRLDEESDSWVPVELPYNLITCVNDNCTVVGSIREVTERREDRTVDSRDGSQRNDGKKAQENHKRLLPLRKRVSLTKMSEASVWITGESGSIYERFWNGVQWVIAPHDLPLSAGPAVSVLIVNQTILALSEEGCLYQMQLTENTQLIWRKFAPAVDNANREQEYTRVKSGIVSYDGERIYLCSKNGSLLELVEVEPPRWLNHGQPPGADVAAIADAGTIRPNVIFTISSAGDLYEHDKSTRPPWKKHVKKGGSAEEASLIPSRGCGAQGLAGSSSMSLFLITKAGELIERRLNQRKWKWIAHGTSEDLLLTAVTPVLQDESSEKFSVFLTTATGSILEYQLVKQAGKSLENQIEERWVNHLHPPHAKVARGVTGTPYQFGRILFILDDGRLGELHLSGTGGENSGPSNQVNFRKRGLHKYIWSILDVPETEGWNAEYCVDERGPSNCIMGVKDEPNDFGSTRTVTRRRKGVQQNYLIPDSLGSNLETPQFSDSWLNNNFRMRVMQGGRSFFLVTGNGLTLEYLYNDNVGLWLRHENPTPMNGAVGSYNGSLFLVDIHGSLLIRERNNNELQWINCTALKKGKQIIGGPPWDLHGTAHKIKADDALYFISQKGRLLQFTVASRIFKWKDCRNPGNIRIAAIVDQEVFRDRVVFVVGTDGKLYQFNTLSGHWHEHQQSPHLILSRVPGTAMRQSALSLKGSLFMISEGGILVEYHWNPVDGWMWVEHGTPTEAVTFTGAPGPGYGGHQLFLIGSDGNVYQRYSEQGEWKWRDCSFPDSEYASAEQERQTGSKHRNKGTCADTGSFDNRQDLNRNCDSKVASTRPILSAEDTLIFELRDGRLAEMHRVKDTDWVWSRILATPTSLCVANLWASVAS